MLVERINMNKKIIIEEEISIKIAEDYYSGRKTLKEISKEMNIGIGTISNCVEYILESGKVDLRSCNEILTGIPYKEIKVEKPIKQIIDIEDRMYSLNENDYASRGNKNEWRNFLESVMK